MHSATSSTQRWLIAASAMMLLPMAVQAQETLIPAQVQDWTKEAPAAGCPDASCCQGDRLAVKFTPYFWLTQMHGTVGLRQATASIDVSMGKMWDLVTNDLNMAFLGQLELQYGRFGFLANGVFFQLSPGLEINNFSFDKKLAQTALDLDFTYDLLGGCTSGCCTPLRLELLAGVRYYSLAADVTVTGQEGTMATAGGAHDWADLVVGARAIMPLNDSWSFLVRADAGGFGINGSSRMSWNVELMAAYHWCDRIDLVAGYRWLDVNYRSGSGTDRLVYDVQTDGPIVGLTLKF